jgi:hypothetical protein
MIRDTLKHRLVMVFEHTLMHVHGTGRGDNFKTKGYNRANRKETLLAIDKGVLSMMGVPCRILKPPHIFLTL